MLNLFRLLLSARLSSLVRFGYSVVFTFTLASLGACQTTDKSSRKAGQSRCQKPELKSLGLVGGRLDSQSFPATVSIGVFNDSNEFVYSCTGTFVRDDLLISAAHCITEAARGNGGSIAFDYDYAKMKKGGIARTKTWLVHPQYRRNSSMNEATKNDLLFVWFPTGTFRGTPARLATAAPSVNEPISVVGYGATAIDPNDFERSMNTGPRRVGRNQIMQIQKNGGDALYWTRPIVVNSEGEAAGVNRGDSGGPVYNAKGQLIGIIRGLGFGVDATSRQRALESWAVNLFYPPLTDYVGTQLKSPAKLGPATGQPQTPLPDLGTETQGDEQNVSNPLGC